MARLSPPPFPSGSEEPRLSSSPVQRSPLSTDTPVSPAASANSDKENRHRSQAKRRRSGPPMPDSVDAEARHGHKRTREARDNRHPPNTPSNRFYDPNQDPEERRSVRKGLRSLFAKLNDSRTEYLKPESRGLEETLREADKLYKSVKQTAEATIDSRIVLETADLSYKKISNLTLGDGAAGVDVDDFVTKCIGFMKRGDEATLATRDGFASTQTQTQTQRRRRRQARDAGEGDEGDTLNWEYLGQNACFLYNARPCLTGFLLGPLSVQKKVRQQTQRKAREGRSQALPTVRPTQLGDDDLEKQETANLTQICTEIARLLGHALAEGAKNVEQACEEEPGTLTEDRVQEILHRYGMADNACVPLFRFCVNPRSFGQTVENLFYVSFLIKEGKVALDFDSHGLPTLGFTPPRSLAERQETQRNQAVFILDFDLWEEIVSTFAISNSIIPHRNDEVYDDGALDYARMETDQDREEEEEAEASDAYI